MKPEDIKSIGAEIPRHHILFTDKVGRFMPPQKGNSAASRSARRLVY